MITDVDDEGAGERLDGHPLPLALDLEARDVILEEQREEAIVGMRRHAERQVGLRAGRVAVDDHQMCAIVKASKKFVADAERFKDSPHEDEEQRSGLLDI